ncbi:magnesium transporter CorA family protein [Clostridium liquoris]|nr:magnesium transporter CorA family protein [Clostridium liquoris]
MRVYDVLNKFSEVHGEEKFEESKYWICCYVDELDSIKHIFQMSKDNIEDCKDFDKSTKIEFLEEYIFIIFNILDYYDEGVHSRELYIFLNKDYIITSYKEDLDLIKNILKDLKEFRNCFMLKKNPDPSMLLYYILDRIILKNYEVISELEAEADKIEIRVLKNPRHEQLNELINLRRQVYKIRKYLNPLRYIGDSLISNDNSMIDDGFIDHFKSLNNKIDKLMMALESLVGDLALAREAFESEIANKTNELMKIFTIIATISLPLNLITSIYGMNVKHIPFMHLEYGYYYVIIMMISISLWLIWLFRRKKWF